MEDEILNVAILELVKYNDDPGSRCLHCIFSGAECNSPLDYFKICNGDYEHTKGFWRIKYK